MQKVSRRRTTRPLLWCVLGAAVAITAWQVLVPPIVGLADQGDFARIIGPFGYGPAEKSPDLKFMYVVRRYVPDRTFRYPEWEQPTSEYLFTSAAVTLNRLVSRSGEFDLTVMGAVHALAFLTAFARLLWAIRRLRAAPVIWLLALLALTDAGYAAYWNSFYAEPASCIFFLLLIGESIDISQSPRPCAAQLTRWSLWAVLWVLAKAQNAPVGLILALFALRLAWWARKRTPRIVAAAGSAAIAAAAFFMLSTIPDRVRWVAGYDMLFRSIIPESQDPAADLATFGLDPSLARYRGTWAEGQPFYAMVTAGIFDRQATPFAIARFYLLRPARLWKHLKVMLRSTFLLRDFYGNFEKAAGYPPATQSRAFTAWSAFHTHVLARAGRGILFLLLLAAIAVAALWFRARGIRRRHLEWFALLLLSCLAALFTVVLGDCWDNIKHFYMFNLLLDACLISLAAQLTAVPLSKRRSAWRRYRTPPRLSPCLRDESEAR